MRRNRALELREAGQELLPGVTDAFEGLVATLDGFNRRSARRPPTVTVEPDFGSKWLLRRLDRFRDHHPGIEIRIDGTHRLVDFQREAVDLGIRYGGGRYPGLRALRIAREAVVPVCSPRLLEGPHPLRTPDDLRWHTLLQTDWNPDFPTWPDWAMWLKAAGVQGIDGHRGPQFGPGSAALVIEAALAGHGVALTSRLLVADDLAAGRLVSPFEEEDFELAFGYFLVGPEATWEAPKISAFREWLLGELRAAGFEPQTA